MMSVTYGTRLSISKLSIRAPVRQFWSRSKKRKPPASIPGQTFSIVKPQFVSSQLAADDIPSHIILPCYYISGKIQIRH